LDIASTMPFSTAGMYSLGTLPPLTSLTNSKPAPAASGSQVSTTRAKSPLPPGLLLELVVDLGGRVAVSR
jgi:hypothetical protein